MQENTKAFSEYELSLEAAIQAATEKLPFDLESKGRRLVHAVSCWDSSSDQQIWVMYWLNECQLWRRTMRYSSDNGTKSKITHKGGGDLKVTVNSEAKVTYVVSR